MKEKKEKFKIDNYEIRELKRSEINLADYNPRSISEENRKKLKKKIKEHGMIQPIIINLRTMNIVSGHQRVGILDEMKRGKEYSLNCACIDVDERKEVELNIFLNNTSAMGEFDSERLYNIKELFPDMDFIDDLGFDKLDIDSITSELDIEDGIFSSTPEIEEIEDKLDDYKKSNIAEKKKKIREKMRDRDAEGDEYHIDNRDYYIVFVFNNNKDKQNFLRKIKKDPNEKYLKSTILYDIVKPEYKV
jgi:hypothetical protein